MGQVTAGLGRTKPPPTNQLFSGLVCHPNKVIEHVDDPKAFMAKLFDTGETVLVSLPHNWRPHPKHRHDYITMQNISEWAGTTYHSAYGVIRDRPADSELVPGHERIWALYNVTYVREMEARRRSRRALMREALLTSGRSTSRAWAEGEGS